MKIRINGFSIIEVVVAMAIFAVIAIPSLGIMSMAIRKNHSTVNAPNASELKRRIDNELRRDSNVFTDSASITGVVLYANESLSKIEISLPEADRYYEIAIAEPSGYDYDVADPYRLFLFRVRWPAFVETAPGTYAANTPSNLEETVLSSALIKLE